VSNFTLQLEEIYASEMFVPSYQSICFHNPEDCNIKMDKCSVTDFKHTFVKTRMHESHVHILALLDHVDAGTQLNRAYS
jgi:hypothetical protein